MSMCRNKGLTKEEEEEEEEEISKRKKTNRRTNGDAMNNLKGKMSGEQILIEQVKRGR